MTRLVLFDLDGTLTDTNAVDGECYVEAGAVALLSRLQEEGWHLCIATGGWATSAELKRRAAGLPEAVPIFSSDLDHTREGILEIAIRRMRELNGVLAYDRVRRAARRAYNRQVGL